MNKFTQRMGDAIHDNSNKVHWSELSQEYLLSLLKKSQDKLSQAIHSNDHAKVRKYSVDVANYCYFLSDNSDRIQKDRVLRQ